jgi:hypothetical protein
MVERGFRTPDGQILVHDTLRGRVTFLRVWFAPAPPAANLVACGCDQLEGMGPHFRYVGPALAEEE